MLEAKFLGGLLPSHPNYEPIIQAIRTKYNLPEIYPQDDPIKEISLGDEIVSIDEFSQDIRNQILENMETMFPKDYVKKYKSAKQAITSDYYNELEKFNDELKPVMEMFFMKNGSEWKTFGAVFCSLAGRVSAQGGCFD